MTTTTTKYPRIEEVLKLALHVFPDGAYWEEVYKLRKNPDNNVITRNDPFHDTFQFAHQPMEETASNGKRQTKVLPFCTVPMTSDHWAVVLLLYVVAQPDYWKNETTVAMELWRTLEPFREEGKLMYHDKIANFGEDAMRYLVARVTGTRNNHFLTDPAGTICNMMSFLEEIGESPGFYDADKEKLTKSLNEEPRATEYQAELRRLGHNNNDEH